MIARGVPRVTRDIAVAFAGVGSGPSALIAELASAGIVPRIADAVAFALPSELETLAAATIESLGGVRLPIARAEDLVIFRAIAWRPQDQPDVERLLALHGDHIDLARVRRHVKELGEAVELDRLRELDAVIARVLFAH